MTQDVEILKKIREKEDEAKIRIEEAKRKAEEIINNARAEAEKIEKEAELRGSTLYQDYVREKVSEASEEARRIRKEYDV
ncbi:MAG: V-type ATPase subunit subunit G family protein, partial [Thermoplasmatales archaeon]